jgi:hypothetical protein
VVLPITGRGGKPGTYRFSKAQNGSTVQHQGAGLLSQGGVRETAVISSDMAAYLLESNFSTITSLL